MIILLLFKHVITLYLIYETLENCYETSYHRMQPKSEVICFDCEIKVNIEICYAFISNIHEICFEKSKPTW